ncbi:MAG: PadR family transcriptional regulator [Candidatus Aenigmarchaeota archaeon]|nr:PadR family transcriptional regulator [Candidatus Aenigmarchaeota archaeon]
MRGMLSFLILFLLSKKPMNGVEIAEDIERRKGTKPSPGTIYPALKGLREMGFVKEKKSGKTVTYSLTSKGKDALRLAKQRFCATFMDVFVNGK